MFFKDEFSAADDIIIFGSLPQMDVLQWPWVDFVDTCELDFLGTGEEYSPTVLLKLLKRNGESVSIAKWHVE